MENIVFSCVIDNKTKSKEKVNIQKLSAEDNIYVHRSYCELNEKTNLEPG